LLAIFVTGRTGIEEAALLAGCQTAAGVSHS
jgi:hypothetical protein